MKIKSVFFSVLALVALAGCQAKITGGSDPGPGPNPPATPEKPVAAYSEAPLAGKVFGQDWKVATAYVRAFGTEGKLLSLNLLSDPAGHACQNSVSPKPYATVAIPIDYAATEYTRDMESGFPLVFVTTGEVAKNLVADFAKLRIERLHNTGFIASVYATATDVDGTKSEINGRVDVVDCRKVADFSVWDQLRGTYQLVELDGKATTTFTASLDYQDSNFYDLSRQTYVRALEFPLYFGVTTTSASKYPFGPLQNLGQTTVTEGGGVKTFNYSYSGPIRFRGVDITMTFTLTVKKSTTLDVTYSLDVPGQISNSTHHFILK